MTHLNTASFVWSIADLLRGPYKQSDYGKVILPFAVLCRLDAVLAPTKPDVLKLVRQYAAQGHPAPDDLLRLATKLSFYNTSELTLADIAASPLSAQEDLVEYLGAFSTNVRDIFERYDLIKQIQLLADRKLLYPVLRRFVAVDLSPTKVSNEQMGLMFEELIRRFAELSNETAGEHYTAREVIQLMVALLFSEDDEALSKPGVVRSVYDPTAGTGGMLAVSEEYVREHNPAAKLALFGQELNDESYAICKADLLIKGYGANNIKQGNTLKHDEHLDEQFDYVLSNPPFGVEWSAAEDEVRAEHARGTGRFAPGLPRRNDGAMLFLLHGLSKLRPAKADGTGGGRMAIVLNGSPLFTGNAGSGESEIRRFILERDLLEAIVALPTDLFYNTAIGTYVWILSNRKAPERKGKVQLIDATALYEKMPKSLGNKRVQMTAAHIARVVRAHGAFVEDDTSRIFRNEDFGYRTVTVERPLRQNYRVSDDRLAHLDDDKKLGKRPDLDQLKAALRAKVGDAIFKSRADFTGYIELALKPLGVSAAEVKAVVTALAERDETAEPARDAKGCLIPDPELRDTVDVPLLEPLDEYLEREVRPYAPDAWFSDDVRDRDGKLGKVGYEIAFTRYFHTYEPLRPLEVIDAELRQRTARVTELLGKILG